MDLTLNLGDITCLVKLYLEFIHAKGCQNIWKGISTCNIGLFCLEFLKSVTIQNFDLGVRGQTINIIKWWAFLDYRYFIPRYSFCMSTFVCVYFQIHFFYHIPYFSNWAPSVRYWAIAWTICFSDLILIGKRMFRFVLEGLLLSCSSLFFYRYNYGFASPSERSVLWSWSKRWWDFWSVLLGE